MGDNFEQELTTFVARRRKFFPISEPSCTIVRCDNSFAETGNLEEYVSLNYEQREQRLLQNVRIGDVFVCEVLDVLDYSGLDLRCVEVHCLIGSNLILPVYTSIPWQVTCPITELPRDDDKEDLTEGFAAGDVLRAVAIHCQRSDGEDGERETAWTVSLRAHRLSDKHRDSIELGLLGHDEGESTLVRVDKALCQQYTGSDKVVHYGAAPSVKTDGDCGTRFIDRICSQAAFRNPACVSSLTQELAINTSKPCTLLEYGTKLARLDETEKYLGLRARHVRELSREIMEEGIDLMKRGQQKEAFERLDTAVKTDPKNADARVARGALHANRGDFAPAIRDFDEVVQSVPDHQNARQYWADTKVAFARKLERTMKLQQAFDHVLDVLRKLPNHAAGLELEKQLKPHVSLVSPEQSTPSTAHRRTSLTTSTAAATSTDGSQWPGRQPHCHVPSDAGSGRSDFSSEDSRSSASVSSSPRHADSHKRKRSRKAASDSAARLGREHKHYRKKKKKKRHYYTSSATSDADSGSSSDSHRHVRKAEKKQRTSLKTKHHKAKKRKHKSGKKHH
ncbi:tetratricopeptide repeat protein 14-like [Sycon ciliatum]|uniref:tetratricopeptide repeat protein 14-like n=1 Tax=Sycon ciliatum TaxID=27933 RepID=UPI0031F6D548